MNNETLVMLKNDFIETMKEMGVLQRDIAEITGLSSGNVSLIVNCKRRIRFRQVKAIAEFMDLDVMEIIGNTPTGNPKFPFSTINIDRFVARIHEMYPTYIAFSERLRIHPSTVSHYITGKTVPSKRRIEDIAEALDTTVEYLTGQSDDPNKPNRDIEETVVEPDPVTVNFKLVKSKEVAVCEEEPDDFLEKLQKVDQPDEEKKGRLIPHIPRKCTDCMFERGIEVLIDSNFSYPASVIEKWCRKSIYHLTDMDSDKYDPKKAEMISELLFSYFVNKKTPLRKDSRYFVREKKGVLHLKRDRGETNTLREYVISHKDTNGVPRATRVTLSESERSHFEKILRDLNINLTIRDLVDILR